jgi:hypothetical protein
MAFWDDVTVTVAHTTKKQVWRIEIFGDLEGNFQFVAHIDRVTYDDTMTEIGRVHLPDVTILHDDAVADVNLEPHMTAIHNQCKALIRLLRTA